MRKIGYTEEEISRIPIARAIGQPAPTAGASAPRIQGIVVEAALNDAVFVYGGGVRAVPVLSKAHLIASKRARGAEKHLSDLVALESETPTLAVSDFFKKSGGMASVFRQDTGANFSAISFR